MTTPKIEQQTPAAYRHEWHQRLQQNSQEFAMKLMELGQQLQAMNGMNTAVSSPGMNSPATMAADTKPPNIDLGGIIPADASASVSGRARPNQVKKMASGEEGNYGSILIAQRQAMHPADPTASALTSVDQLYARTLAPYGMQDRAIISMGLNGTPVSWTDAQARDILGSSAPSLSFDAVKAVGLINQRRIMYGMPLITAEQLTPMGTVVT